MTHYLEFTPEGRAEGLHNLYQAIDRDPNFAPGHALAAIIIENGCFFGDFEEPKQILDKGLDLARKSVQLDPRDALGYCALGRVYSRRGEFIPAIRELNAAIALNPNLTTANFALGIALYYAGRQTDALAHLQTELRLNPNDPGIWSFHHMAARCYLDQHLYEKAHDSAQRATSYRSAPMIAFAALAASAAMLGKQEEASMAIKELHRKDSRVTLRYALENFGSEPTREALDHFIDALRKAGLPE